MNKKAKHLFLFILTFVFSIVSTAQRMLTYFEKSHYKRTPRYDSTIYFCKELDKKSPYIFYTTFGKSHENRDLPLLIAASNKEFTPEKAHKSGKNIVLIQACIHAGECDGKDAGLMLFRDFIEKQDLQILLNDNIILFIPIFNVDGHERFSPYNRINQNGPEEMGWRANAINLDLNRDYIKAQSLEMKAWLKLFHSWKPHFFIDCHTTDGADYQYPITYGMEYCNLDSSLSNWQNEVFIPKLKAKMDSCHFPIFRYVSFRNWFDFESGLTAGYTPPNLSHGYTTLVNCPGLLIESHMLKDYKTRVFVTYEMIKNSLKILSEEKNKLQQMTNKITFKNIIPVSFKTTHDSTIVEFKGYEYNLSISDLTGSKWYKYSNVPKIYYLPFFDKIEVVKNIVVPRYYVVPCAWSFLLKEYFLLHDIKYIELNKDTLIEATFYKFSNVKLSDKPSEFCQKVISYSIDTIKKKRVFYKGSLLVPLNQRNYKILVNLIEPESPVSLFCFGFFNSIFEQKEYGESYVLENLAREMLLDEKIKREFEEFKKQEPTASGYQILNWFYNKSIYADPWLNVYPIGKVY